MTNQQQQLAKEQMAEIWARRAAERASRPKTELETISEILRSETEDRFAVLARLFKIEKSDFGVAELCLDLCQKGTLQRDELNPHFGVLKDRWEATRTKARALEGDPESIDWMFTAEYEPLRSYLGISQDLFGYLNPEAVVPVLGQALGARDPWVKCWAAISLLRHGSTVPDGELMAVVESDEVRITLWEQLRQLKQQSLVPDDWASPLSLAASSLTRWAGRPMEFGYPPLDVQPYMEIPVTGYEGFEEAELSVFLFRFGQFPCTSIDPAKRFAGIAGPFHNGERLDSPWSSREEWDKRTPEEHFDKMYNRSAGACCSLSPTRS